MTRLSGFRCVRRTLFAATVVLLLIAVLGGVWAAAQAQPGAPGGAVVGPMPREALVDAGETMSVTIEVRDVSALYGADVRLAFDPTYVEVVDADPSEPGVQVHLLSGFLTPDWVLRNQADNQDGTIWYAVAQMNPSKPVTGTGALADITFRGLVAGTTPITVTYRELARGDGFIIASTAEDGRVVVTTGGRTATPGATPTRRPTSVRSPTPAETEEPTDVPPASPTVVTATSTAPSAGTATPTARPPVPVPIYLPCLRMDRPPRAAVLQGERRFGRVDQADQPDGTTRRRLPSYSALVGRAQSRLTAWASEAEYDIDPPRVIRPMPGGAAAFSRPSVASEG
jgi:hypothetical protein